jgi:hypothetical protein
MLRTPLCLLLLSPLLAPDVARAQGPEQASCCTRLEVDHIPVAVHSLDAAARTYEALGFTLKPGRAHRNGLRNSFAKMPDGGYLELISPERGAVDDLSSTYVERLASGEGGAFLALRVDSLAAVAERLRASGRTVEVQRYGSAFATLSFAEPAISWLFLIEYTTPVVDPPELLTHSNGATHIESVWLSQGGAEATERLPSELCIRGLHSGAAEGGDRLVQGVTIGVRSVAATQLQLRRAGLDLPIRNDRRGESLLVPADRAHGIWIEFLQLARLP